MGETVSVALDLVIADAVSAIQSFVHVFILVYVLLIFIYIITSWFQLPYRPWLHRIRQFLADVCEPYLRLYRRFLPPLGPIDLSPMVAVLVLVILDQVLVSLLDQFR